MLQHEEGPQQLIAGPAFHQHQHHQEHIDTTVEKGQPKALSLPLVHNIARDKSEQGKDDDKPGKRSVQTRHVSAAEQGMGDVKSQGPQSPKHKSHGPQAHMLLPGEDDSLAPSHGKAFPALPQSP